MTQQQSLATGHTWCTSLGTRIDYAMEGSKLGVEIQDASKCIHCKGDKWLSDF